MIFLCKKTFNEIQRIFSHYIEPLWNKTFPWLLKVLYGSINANKECWFLIVCFSPKTPLKSLLRRLFYWHVVNEVKFNLIYIYAFSRRFATYNSGYTFSCVFPGNRTHNLLRCWHNALPLSHTGTLLHVQTWHMMLSYKSNLASCVSMKSFNVCMCKLDDFDFADWGRIFTTYISI